MFEVAQNLHFTNVIWQVILPLVLSLVDIITGYLQARINNDVQSKIMREGLIHKILQIIIIAVSFMFQFAFNLKSISVIVCIYICLMELTSIVENLKKAGIDFKIFEILLGKGENDNGETK